MPWLTMVSLYSFDLNPLLSLSFLPVSIYRSHLEVHTHMFTKTIVNTASVLELLEYFTAETRLPVCLRMFQSFKSHSPFRSLYFEMITFLPHMSNMMAITAFGGAQLLC